MSESTAAEVGTIAWTDLTVENAEQVRDFYQQVVGWEPAEVDMGDYHDYAMNAPASGRAVAGVCHARGMNADLPPQWLIYITVENLDQSISRCTELGGQVIAGPKGAGGEGRYCVIRDPAGAAAVLMELAR